MSATSAPAKSVDPAYAELQKYARSQGYRPFKRQAETVWCKHAAALGSRFETTTCLTEAAIADLERNAVNTRQAASHALTCIGTGCVVR